MFISYLYKLTEGPANKTLVNLLRSPVYLLIISTSLINFYIMWPVTINGCTDRVSLIFKCSRDRVSLIFKCSRDRVKPGRGSYSAT